MSKRVYCLYRVSTKGQVEKDDIPMQKQVCYEYAEKMGWDIVREFSEKGISGFKVSAKDRDAIQEIQKDAAQGKFDILLVFMFDRLGRREDETPFVVEWFAQNGIEVWSTVEGQQRFDNHVDKLMNYIRYWQASGESIKTSIRVKTRLGQLVQEGKFRGGTPCYGYKLVKKGRLGKKNRELYDLEIEPNEAVAVVSMFDLAEHFGYGGRRISTELAAKGIVNLRTGEPFHYSSIQNILKNPQYVGILRSGDTFSDIFPELQIIPKEQFDRVQKGREQRSAAYLEKCKIADLQRSQMGSAGGLPSEMQDRLPARIVGRALLSGNIYCGHCGGRMFASTARKSHHTLTNTETVRVPIYKCYNRAQHPGVCDGPATYRAEKVDRVVQKLIEGIFQRAKTFNASEFVKQQVELSALQYHQQLQQMKCDYAKAVKELSKWENLMLASVEGTCVFTPEQVKKQMDGLQVKTEELAAEIVKLEDKSDHAKAAAEEIQQQHDRILSWAELFESASIDEKKMIASNLIKAVTLTRDYGITVDFNIAEAQYLSGLEMG